MQDPPPPAILVDSGAGELQTGWERWIGWMQQICRATVRAMFGLSASAGNFCVGAIDITELACPVMGATDRLDELIVTDPCRLCRASPPWESQNARSSSTDSYL